MNGDDLIKRGYAPGPHFKDVLSTLNQREHSEVEIAELLTAFEPPVAIGLQPPAPCIYNITATTEHEISNVAAVKRTMDAVLRTPVVKEAVVMPDACPAGALGVIPVGGVVATDSAIVPGMHSADICCSLMMTIVGDVEPSVLLDAVHKATHFGPGGRQRGRQIELSQQLIQSMRGNFFLKDMMSLAQDHMGTQGDGNHFAYVGTLESSGQTVLVTHHGSRAVGARLYSKGMKVAEKVRQIISPDTLKSNAWIPLDSRDGENYWEALQIVREWTRQNHVAIHDLAIQNTNAKIIYRRWNEHNFVFREDMTLYHAKGATPVHNAYMPDTDGVQIIPLNMAEPILLVKGERTDSNLGFAPHGAGRNRSRTAHMKSLANRNPEDVLAEETQGIDARFWLGKHDLSELPSAYKDAQSVQDDMDKFGLASVCDRVLPYGSIMAGDWQQDAPWRRKKRKAAKPR